MEASPIAKTDAGTAGPLHVPDTLPTSIDTPVDVGLHQWPDTQVSLNTPVMDMQVSHQAAAPKTVKATTAEQQGTAWTSVAQMIPHTPVLSDQILDLSRRSAPETTLVTTLASHH